MFSLCRVLLWFGTSWNYSYHNNESSGVLNHRRLHCLLNSWFRRRSKKTSKLRVTNFCAGNSPVTCEFPAQKAINARNVSIWWRHHDPSLLLRWCWGNQQPHYNDVIMTTIASQITSLTIAYSTVYSDADQRKHQSSASLAFVWGFHRDRWIPRTKGQLRGKCFHLMTSSCYNYMWMQHITVKSTSRSECSLTITLFPQTPRTCVSTNLLLAVVVRHRHFWFLVYLCTAPCAR